MNADMRARGAIGSRYAEHRRRCAARRYARMMQQQTAELWDQMTRPRELPAAPPDRTN